MDDVVIVRSQSDVTVVGNIVETFGKISAVEVNWMKSKALVVGRLFSPLSYQED